MLHTEMEVWKLSMDMVEDVYRLTNKFPKSEVYTLVSQMKRSAISVPSNIAEGMSRNSTKECIRFLHFSLASLSELDTQLILSKRLSFIDEYDTSKLVSVKKLLLGTINHLKAKL